MAHPGKSTPKDDSNSHSYRGTIKDLKLHKDFYELLLHLMPEGVLVLDDKSRPVFCNQCARLLLNFDHDDLQYDDLAASFLGELIKETEDTEFISYRREIELHDPTERFLNVICIPLTDHRPKAYRVFLIHDATREKLNDRYAGRNPHFFDSLTLGAGIAHELGNPIASLSLHAELMKRILNRPEINDREKSQLKESALVLTEELKRLDSTVKDFLSAVRPTNPQFQLNPIQDVVKMVMDTLKTKAREKHIAIVYSEEDTIAPFLFDANRVSQALTNIVLNAIDFSPTHANIDIKIIEKKNFCEIHVTDYGKGIQKEDLEKIFEPYYTTKENGNGLGLLISYRIMRDHGGSINVKSQPGVETSFILSLPLRYKALKQLPAVKS